MKINKPHGKFKHLAVAVSVVFGLTACFDSNDEANPPSPPPTPPPPPSNVAPVVSSSAPTSAEEGVLYVYSFAATDGDAGDTLVFAAVTLPGWLTFDITTGELSGTPAAGDVGENSVSLTVSDGTVTISQNFIIAVTAAPVMNSAPTFTSTGLTTGTVGNVYSYTATATDVDTDDVLVFSSVTLPNWATFNIDTAVLSGTPDMAGDYPVELSVSDGTDSTAQTFTVAVTEASTNVALSIFETNERADWASWLCCNATTVGQVVTDEDVSKDQVMEFTIDTATGTVAGFTAREVDGAVGGMPFDASAFTSTGVLQFDLKLVENGPAGAQPWLIKIESNASGGQFIELPLSDANEGHTAPEIGVWQTYTFNLSDLAGSLDQSGIDLIMVFPAFAPAATGIVFRLDNVKILEDGASTPTPPAPPTPSNPTDLAISIFDTAERADWASWLCCNATTVGQVVTDEDATKAEVMEFTIDTATGTVAGFTAREVDGAVGGMPFDASAFTSTGVLQFDLKLVENGPAGAQPWLIKIESNASGGQFIELPLSDANEGHTAPEIGVWQTYTFNLSDLAGSLDQSGIDLIMVFPAFAPAATGIVFRLDNVKIFRDGASSGGGVVPGPTGGITDIGDTGLVSNGGFELGNLDGWLAEGANIAVEADDMGTYLVKIVAAEAASPFIRQARIGEGVVSPNQAVTVSFDMKGTASDGGVVNAILFTEAPSGVSKTDVLITTVPSADWQNYSFNVTAGTDTEWGLALTLQPACGAVLGCEVTAYFDNVIITAQ